MNNDIYLQDSTIEIAFLVENSPLILLILWYFFDNCSRRNLWNLLYVFVVKPKPFYLQLEGLFNVSSDASSLVVFKARMDEALSSPIYLKVSLPMAGGLEQMVFKVSSNPNHSMILQRRKFG